MAAPSRSGLTAMVGSAASGGTNRANADIEDFFVFLWDGFSDAIFPVSGGRTGSAAADFALDKTITLPDRRNKVGIGAGDSYPLGTQQGDANTGDHTILIAEFEAHAHDQFGRNDRQIGMDDSVSIENTGTELTGLTGGSGPHNHPAPVPLSTAENIFIKYLA